jgi:2-dehydropantoate 2-reductase
MNQLKQCKFGFEFISNQEMETQALQKVILNSCVNPLVSLFEAKNGALMSNPELVNMILKEIGNVVDIPRIDVETLIHKVISDTKENKNSMLVDVLAGRETEIDYLNGYFVNIGRQRGIPTPLNEFLVQLIKAKSTIRDSFKL